MSLVLEYKNDTNAMIIGELTRQHVANFSKKQRQSLFKKDTLQLNLSQVSKVDTSGLAWILLLVECANLKNHQLSFSNLPNDLVKLAKLSTVEALIPTDSN